MARKPMSKAQRRAMFAALAAAGGAAAMATKPGRSIAKRMAKKASPARKARYKSALAKRKEAAAKAATKLKRTKRKNRNSGISQAERDYYNKLGYKKTRAQRRRSNG